MGETKELTIQKIANINAACAAIGENEAIDATIGYRLGRLADYTERIVKSVHKQQQTKMTAFRERILKLTDQEKTVENGKLTQELNDLMETTEEVSVPEFNYSDFVAKTDMTVGKREYKSGQLLVPIKFFSLMGELIIDDKKLMPKQPDKKSKK